MSSPTSVLNAAPSPVAPDWNAQTLDATFAALSTTRLGLSSAEAARRVQLRAVPRKRAAVPEPLAQNLAVFLALAFSELSDPVHLLLFLVAVAGATLGAPAVAVAVVALTLARIGLLAGAAYYGISVAARLRTARAPHARVRRDGELKSIDVAQLAPGDVIELAMGARVPADAKLIDHDALTIDGAVLAGTANGAGDAVTPLVWAGGWVTHGRATAVIVATGADAADAMLSRLQTPADETPPADEADTLASWRPSLRLDRANVFVLLAAAVLLLAALLRGTAWLHTLMAAVALAAVSWSVNLRWLAPLQKLAAAAGAVRLLAGGAAVRDIEVVVRLAALPMASGEATGASVPAITTAGSADADRARESADVVFDGAPEKLAESMALAATTARGALGAAARAATLAQSLWAALLGTGAGLAMLLVPAWPASVLLALHVLALALSLALCHAQHPTTLSTQPPRWLFWTLACAIGLAAVVATRFGTRLSADTASLAFASFGVAALLFALEAATERRNAWRTRLNALWQGREAAQMLGAIALSAAAIASALHVPLLRDAFETAALSAAAWGVVVGIALAAVVLQFAGVVAWRKWRAPRAAPAPNVTPAADA